MKAPNMRTLFLPLAIFVVTGVAPLDADEPAVPAATTESSAAGGSVQEEVDQRTSEIEAERRAKITQEASTALRQTKLALEALEDKRIDDALAALEVATGKLELILARDPSLALAPVSVDVVTYDLVASPEKIKALIREAEEYLEDGEIQKARPIVANLASEIVVRTTNIPLASYPAAIKEMTPLIDEGKIDEAKAGLVDALNTLVVTTDDVLPLPIMRAEELLKKAEELATKEERTEEDNTALTDYLESARTQIEIAELLGYGSEEEFASIYEQLDEIGKMSAGGATGDGWFATIRRMLSDLF